MAKLSVILPVYNAPEDVRVCLDSLARNFDEQAGELLIINDASAEETSRLLRAFAAQRTGTRLLEHTENRGYLRTVNEGIAEARGDVLTLLNSDTAVPEGFAERVLACFASHPRIGLASPVGSHCGLFSIPMKPGLSGADVDKMDARLRGWQPEYPTVILPDGFCFCMRRAMLDEVGLFDERYEPGYFEETDMGMRARQAGWETVLIDNVYVYHKAQASFGASRNQELVARNERLFQALWGEEFQSLRARWPREEHKPRLYRRIYSGPERAWRKTVRFFASFIPVSNVRRRIRRAYN